MATKKPTKAKNNSVKEEEKKVTKFKNGDMVFLPGEEHARYVVAVKTVACHWGFLPSVKYEISEQPAGCYSTTNPTIKTVCEKEIFSSKSDPDFIDGLLEIHDSSIRGLIENNSSLNKEISRLNKNVHLLMIFSTFVGICGLCILLCNV